MPTEKIDSSKSEKICTSSEHKAAIVLEPGTYKHTCPKCGDSYVFRVSERPWL